MTLKRTIETGSKNFGNGLKASKVQVVEAKKKPEVRKKHLTKSETSWAELCQAQVKLG